MKKHLLFALFSAALLLPGADLEIINNKRSVYKIVYADEELYPFHNRYSSISTKECS